MAGLLHCVVAIAAIKTELTHVQRVAVRNGLLRLIANPDRFRSRLRAEIQQQANELVKNSTVQEFDELEKLKFQKEKEAQKRKQFKKKAKKRRQQQDDLETDPEATGRILDTRV